MLFPNTIEEQLGFHHIRAELSRRCLGPLGREMTDKMRFSNDYRKVDRWTAQVHEFKNLLAEGVVWPANEYNDFRHYLGQASIQGTFLVEEDLYELVVCLRLVSEWRMILEEHPDEFPSAQPLIQHWELDRSMVRELERVFDKTGKLKDNASKELATIRRGIIKEGSSLRKTLDSVLRTAKDNNQTDADARPTLRNGRMVIPVKAEYKRIIGGLVHDESATGKTAYLEPTNVFSINNRLKELYAEERREIIRILTELTNLVREHLEDLEKSSRFLGHVDFLRAKAMLARDLGAVCPKIDKDVKVVWKKAYHPLLKLNPHGKEVIPLDINLSNNDRILLISGPNAGGKSVSLKTVGLLQYMLQCGLLVPVDESSIFGVFQDVLIDIGDQQSLENELSTYSAHLQNMKVFLAKAGRKSLMLIDEFGTGTEPEYGGALAEAILEALNRKGAYGVITTHYGNLKEFSEKTEGLTNGAMLFDLEHLEPLFKLEIGKPGSSFALEIAKKAGISNQVLSYASKHVGKGKVRYDKELKKLEAERVKLEERLNAVQTQERRLKQSVADYQELKDLVDNRKKAIIQEAKQEAKGIVREANKKVENLISDIREGQAEKELTKELRQEFQGYAQKFEDKAKKPAKPMIQEVAGEIKVGDSVNIKGQDAIGQVTSMSGNQVEVMVGQLKVMVKKNKLVKVAKSPSYAKKSKTSSNIAQQMINRKASFDDKLDVRGMRAPDALAEVDRFLDNAIITGTAEITILHGTGTGVLKQMIRQHLKGYKQVVSVSDGDVDKGGAGLTIVVLE